MKPTKAVKISIEAKDEKTKKNKNKEEARTGLKTTIIGIRMPRRNNSRCRFLCQFNLKYSDIIR